MPDFFNVDCSKIVCNNVLMDISILRHLSPPLRSTATTGIKIKSHFQSHTLHSLKKCGQHFTYHYRVIITVKLMQSGNIIDLNVRISRSPQL